MDFENERYIKVYVRDTLNWAALGWEGQAVLVLLMRKMDRVGIVDIGSLDPVAALTALTGIPREITAVAWPRLSAPDDPSLTLRGGKTSAVFMPNFLPGQEANQSDKARQKKTRETRRASELLTSRDSPPAYDHQKVTPRDKTSLLAAPAALASPADLVKQQPRAKPEEKPEPPAAADQGTTPEPDSPLAIYLRRAWPDLDDPVTFARVCGEAYPALDLVVVAKSARAAFVADNPTRKPAVKYLRDWFGREKAGAPLGRGSYGTSGGGGGHETGRRTPSSAETRKLLQTEEENAKRVQQQRAARGGKSPLAAIRAKAGKP